ncbi:MAG: hypothetical protein MRQ13_04210 [Candidatus Midichloria sp.]|nr:hypothetical protein [Candidatus Midichloria sp.]
MIVKDEIPIQDSGEITAPVSFTIGASIGSLFGLCGIVNKCMCRGLG